MASLPSVGTVTDRHSNGHILIMQESINTSNLGGVTPCVNLLKPLETKDSPSNKSRVIALIKIFGPFFGLALILSFIESKIPQNSAQQGSMGVKVGERMYVGATNCDKAIKNQLTDPGSYQRIETQIIDVKHGEGWVAETQFRARNGLDGYQVSTAQCLFDGREYRALIN